MNNNHPTALDATTIEDVVDEIGFDVLDSILEDGGFGSTAFENTMEMFDDTLLQNSLEFKDLDGKNLLPIDIETSFEPIMLDDNILDSFNNITDVKSIHNTEKNRAHTRCNNATRNSCTLDPKSIPSSTMNLTAEQNVPDNNGGNQAQDSNMKTTSSAELKSTNNNTTLSSICGNKYRDCSKLTDEDAVAGIKYENLRGRTKELFPVKLHKIIEYSERYGFSSVISWMPHGRSFKIHDEGVFVEKVMSHFFFQSKISSFTRQLRMYGFHKIKGNNNVDKGAYFNELFLRGRPGLCHGIVRLEKPCALHKKDEPSFYLYPPMPSCDEPGDIKPKSETPKCIRYSDIISTEKPVLLNKRPLSVSSGVKQHGVSNPVIGNKCLNVVNPAIRRPHMFQNLGGLPQTLNADIGKNVQVIYVFQGGPVPTNNSFPVHLAAQRRYCRR